MEKLLVTLVQVGTQKGFLEATYGLHGANTRTVRVGYHLHGAVVTAPSADNSPLADQKSSWLSRRLLDEKVLRQDGAGLYLLGEQPEAAILPGEFETTLGMTGNELRLTLSTQDCARLADPENEGVYFQDEIEPPLHYYVEKDFPCVHPRASSSSRILYARSLLSG